MTVPTGNGESRGPEVAPAAGTPLPSRPARAAANNARNKGFLGSGPPKDQGGFGTEDMCADTVLTGANEFWSQAHAGDLPSFDDAGHPYGGS